MCWGEAASGSGPIDPAGPDDPFMAGGPVDPFGTLSPSGCHPAGPAGPYVARWDVASVSL